MSFTLLVIILIGRSAIQRVCLIGVCLFLPFHSMYKNLHYLRNVSMNKIKEANLSLPLVVYIVKLLAGVTNS